jgi:hypothetical protein|tara:strand:+ start:630 stop:761 length:132 start_codon:yes stop_codon:yes gene_type:complete
MFAKHHTLQAINNCQQHCASAFPDVPQEDTELDKLEKAAFKKA